MPVLRRFCEKFLVQRFASKADCAYRNNHSFLRFFPIRSICSEHPIVHGPSSALNVVSHVFQNCSEGRRAPLSLLDSRVLKGLRDPTYDSLNRGRIISCRSAGTADSLSA